MGGTVRLEYRDKIAVITNDNPEKRNAFDDDMDTQLFDDPRRVAGPAATCARSIWRGEGKSWSSGRDVSTIGGGDRAESAHHDLMRRGHEGILQVFDIDAPIIVAIQGWAIGGSFQRALLVRHPRRGRGRTLHARRRSGHGVIPDTGGDGTAVRDLRSRRRQRHGAHRSRHGARRRRSATGSCRASSPADELDEVVFEMAAKIAAAPAVTVKMARRVIRHLAEPQIRSSMADELICQTFINKSDDYAEFRAARAEEREPRYTGS